MCRTCLSNRTDMNIIDVKIKSATGNVPMYETPGSAGCDLRNAGNSIIIPPKSRRFVQTGISIELPAGFEAQVRGRSGLNRKNGIVVPTGTIDSDYRGEIGVVVYNLGDDDFLIQPGERIAQLVVCPVFQVNWILSAKLNTTERGNGGFGHTGK